MPHFSYDYSSVMNHLMPWNISEILVRVLLFTMELQILSRHDVHFVYFIFNLDACHRAVFLFIYNN